MNQAKQQWWNTDTILLALCILVGTLLRIGNPAELSFINDELSTWAKVSYDSVGGVIANIKAEDSHPVGMYVFVYYWTAIFGTTEFAIKLPFLLMSIASMFLVYRIATVWFSKSVALLALAFFCSLQFPIWWSAIARQYQSGLFCTLVMTFCWTKILIEKDDRKRYWAGFVLMGAVAMYNHYFSLIFAALIGVSGLIWIRKEILLKYIGAGILMVLLFAPHIGITNYQLLHADGHLWYNTPTPSFFTKHFSYVFHYSILSWGIMLFLIIASILFYGKRTFKENNKSRWIAFLWFLTPLLFGYFYSVYKSPILRESHLLFSFPYLLFFLLSFFPKDLPNKVKIVAVLSILVLNTYSLIVTRNHFKVVNTHPYEHFVTETKAFLEKHKASDVTIVLGENPLYLQYYKDAYQANFNHVESFKPNIAFLEFREILQNSVTSYLIVGSLPQTHIQMAMDYYPYLYKKSYGVNYEYYILSKEEQLQTEPLIIDYKSEQGFDGKKNVKGWRFEPYKVIQDRANDKFYYNMPGEWGPTFSIDLAKITPRNNQFLEIALDLRVVDSIPVQPKGSLVVEILDQQDSVLAWKGIEIHHQTKAIKEWQRVYFSVRFAHENFYGKVKDLKMNAFFWNKEKQAVHLDRFTITSRKGNLILYGDTNDFKD
jgi:hypothetical protein